MSAHPAHLLIESNGADQLAQSRRELRALLQPRSRSYDGRFPRSTTMRLLMSSKGGTLATVALGALLVAKLPFARQLLRLLPAGAIVRLMLNMPRETAG